MSSTLPTAEAPRFRRVQLLIILWLAVLLLLGGCLSDQEARLTNQCVAEFFAQGLFNAETGGRITAETNRLLADAVLLACSVKAELSVDGYRVEPTLSVEEYRAFSIRNRDVGSFRAYLKEELRCDADPDACTKRVRRKGKFAVAAIALALIGGSAIFGRSVYRAAFKQDGGRVRAAILGAVAAIGPIGSFALTMWFGFLRAEGVFQVIAWVAAFVVPYFVATRLCKLVGIDLNAR